MRRRTIALLLAVGFCAFMPAVLDAQPVGYSDIPPTPRGVKVTCRRGSSVAVPLTVTNLIPSEVRYRIIESPNFGVLDSIVQHTLVASQVIYKHNGERSGPDFFTFTAQFGGATASVAVRAEIAIVETPIIFELPPEIVFPATPVGATTLRKISITKPGGGDGVLHLECKPPWSLPDGNGLEVFTEEPAEILLAYTPEKLGESLGILQIRDGERVRTVSLQGEGTMPFSVKVVEEALDEWTLANLSDVVIVVNIKVPAGIICPNKITLPPGVAVPVVARRSPGHTTRIQGELIFSVADAIEKIPISMPAEPAKIAVEPRKIDFGKLDYGAETTTTIELTNSGASTAYLVANLPKCLTITPEPGSTPLRSGETVQWKVCFRAGEKAAGVFYLCDAGDNRLDIEWSAIIIPPPGPLPSVFVDGVRVPLEEEKTFVKNDWRVPIPEMPRLLYTSANRIQIAWNSPHSDSHHYRIEQRIVGSAEDADSAETWQSWEPTLLVREGSEMRATFAKCPPATQWTLRIICLDDEGLQSAPSALLDVATTHKQSFDVMWSAWLLFVGLAMFALLALGAAFRTVMR